MILTLIGTLLKLLGIVAAILLALMVLAAGIVMLCVLWGMADYEDSEGRIYGKRDSQSHTDSE